jgi:adenylyl-sulfate kinase
MNKGLIFWFTGLSGAGKSTVAEAICSELSSQEISTLILDGDDIRNHLHKHLGFSEEDIKQNNFLISELCIEKRNHYEVILVPIISPFASSRTNARKQIGKGFFEIYFNAGLDSVIERDTKGLYAKASAGEIENLIGFSGGPIYERPLHPDFTVNTVDFGVSQSVSDLLEFILRNVKTS